MAYPHFKSGTKKMFLNTPTDGTGKRKFLYVGTDEKAQAEALAKIARHYQQERILRELRHLEYELKEKEREVSRIHSGAASIVQQTAKALKDADRPEKRIEIEARPRNAVTFEGDDCPHCGEEDCEGSCTAAISAGSPRARQASRGR